jgi:hypothetical protein
MHSLHAVKFLSFGGLCATLLLLLLLLLLLCVTNLLSGHVLLNIRMQCDPK